MRPTAALHDAARVAVARAFDALQHTHIAALRADVKQALVSLSVNRQRTALALVGLALGVAAEQPAVRSSSKRRIASRRSRAGSGRSASSTLKLRYDRVRMDSMFMVRVLLQWVCVHRRLPEPAPAAGFRCRSRTQPVMAVTVPNLSEPAQGP